MAKREQTYEEYVRMVMAHLKRVEEECAPLKPLVAAICGRDEDWLTHKMRELERRIERKEALHYRVYEPSFFRYLWWWLRRRGGGRDFWLVREGDYLENSAEDY